MTKKPTLRELAQKARVNHTTISRALRNDPRLPEATRNRLKKLAEKSGYQIDALAQRYMTAIRRGRGNRSMDVLGLLTSQVRIGQGGAAFDGFCRNIKKRAAELGYHIDELWAGEPGMTAKRISSIIAARNIEGLIIPPNYSNPGGHLSLDLSKLAVVLHCHNVWRPQLHRVEPHNFQNMLIVMRKLRRLGYRRIGLMLFAGMDQATGHEWEGAYHYYHAAHPALDRISVYQSDNYDDEGLLKWTKAERPEVIVGAYEFHPEVFREHGFRVPEDIGLVSMGVHPWEKPMAGLDMRAEEIDRASVDVVVDQLNRHEMGVPKIPRHTLIEGIWRDGPTVRAAK